MALHCRLLHPTHADPMDVDSCFPQQQTNLHVSPSLFSGSPWFPSPSPPFSSPLLQIHLLNLVWPNIFETSPHLVQAVMGTIDGMRLALGPALLLGYVLQVREEAGEQMGR